ncbi:hypothetical protein LAV82_22645 [Bacillus sp. ILBB4]|nr:hypothetical protein [Bacillus sp. ILBB4]
MAKNKVIAGDFEGHAVKDRITVIQIEKNWLTTKELTKDTIASYEVIDETQRKSATSAVGRAFVGGAILGPVGLLAGLSAKSKGTHLLAIEFKTGEKSLIEVDDRIYKTLIKILF